MQNFKIDIFLNFCNNLPNIFLKNLIKSKSMWYRKLEIIKEEKIYVMKNVILIYSHKSGFWTQISNGFTPYVIVAEAAIKISENKIYPI